MANVNGSPFKNDDLHGTDRADVMNGYAGNDVFHGSRGADVIDGGSGTDTVDYSASQQSATSTLWFNGVVADLEAGVGGLAGDAGGDTYISIENVTGSAFNDLLAGNNDINVLLGGGGDDLIEGLGGGDVLGGGAGNDILSYQRSDAAVKVDLQYNTATGGHATRDTINGFEHAWGSAYNDVLSGNNGANWLLGNGGSDKLYGRGGADTLEGGAGNDTIDGGADVDTISGGEGDDTLTGGSGADTFNFSASDEAASDTITDFEIGTDRIVIDVADPDSATLTGYWGGADDGRAVFKYESSDGTSAWIWIDGVDTVEEFVQARYDFEFV